MSKTKQIADIDQQRAKRKNRLREETEWRKAKAPKYWHPRAVGDELVGYYQSRTVKSGSHGEYTAALIRVPHQGLFYATGADLIRQLDGESVCTDDPVRVVYKGRVEWAPGKEKKLFDLFVEADH